MAMEHDPDPLEAQLIELDRTVKRHQSVLRERRIEFEKAADAIAARTERRRQIRRAYNDMASLQGLPNSDYDQAYEEAIR